MNYKVTEYIPIDKVRSDELYQTLPCGPSHESPISAVLSWLRSRGFVFHINVNIMQIVLMDANTT
jgi:hypothetical protein